MSSSIAKFISLARANKLNVVYSSFILINHFAYGTNVSLLGATLVDLRFIYNEPIDAMSYTAMAVGIGYLLGAFVSWLYTWLNRQLTLIVFVSILAVSCALEPFYQKLPIALAALVLNGIGGGAWDAASGYWMVEMWPEGNAGMLQLMQFMYGAGTAFAPLLAAPFVRGEPNDTDPYDPIRNVTVEDRIHSLTMPFALVGGIQMIVPMLWLILFFTHPFQSKVTTPTKAENAKEVEANVDTLHQQQIKKIKWRKIKILLCGLALAVESAAELGWFYFAISMYQYLDPIKYCRLDAETSAHTMSILSGAYTFGRLATTFISIKVAPDIIIAYHLVIIVCSLIGLLIGLGNYTAIVIASACLGYGFSAMWPAILAFTERHLRLSDRVTSVFSIMTGFGSLITPIVLGQTFKKSPLMLFALVGGFMAISLALFVLVCAWIYFDQWREKQWQQSKPVEQQKF